MMTTGARKFWSLRVRRRAARSGAIVATVFRYRTCHLDIEDGDPKTAAFGPACCTPLGSAPPLVRIAFRRLRIGVMLMRLLFLGLEAIHHVAGAS